MGIHSSGLWHGGLLREVRRRGAEILEARSSSRVVLKHTAHPPERNGGREGKLPLRVPLGRGVGRFWLACTPGVGLVTCRDCSSSRCPSSTVQGTKRSHMRFKIFVGKDDDRQVELTRA